MACSFARSLITTFSRRNAVSLLQKRSCALALSSHHIRLLPRLSSVSVRLLPYSSSATVAPNNKEDFKSTSTLETISNDVETLPASKLFAVVHISGRQFKITKNDLILVHRISADVGSKIILEKILLAASENFSLIGTPLLRKEVVRVHATVIEHVRLAKVIIFQKKKRKGYKKKKGHRQDMTTLRINDIKLNIDAVNEQ